MEVNQAALDTNPHSAQLVEMIKNYNEISVLVIGLCIVTLQNRLAREEYGHAKAAVALDIEALEDLKKTFRI